MLRRWIAPPVVALASLAFACTSTSDDEASSAEAAHTEARHVTDNSPFLWVDEPYEELRKARELLGVPIEPAIADDEPLTIRVQAWMDRIDGLVREDVLRQTGRPLVAPRPVAKVVQSATTFNAWVSGRAACLGAPLGFGGAPESGAYLDRAQAVPYPNAVCSRVDWAPSAFVSFWNASRPPCRLSIEGGALRIDGACQVEPGTIPASQIISSATSPYIHFSTDYVAEQEEIDLALTVAHELGHYYQAHSAAAVRWKHFFWFVRADSEREARPAPDAAELEAAYAEVANPDPDVGPPLGKRYSPRMRPLLVNVVWRLLDERREHDAPCAAARDALAPIASRVALSGRAPTAEERERYESFERELDACSPHVALAERGPQSLSAGELLTRGARFRPGPKVTLSMRPGDSLADFLERLDSDAKELDAKTARLVERARRNHVGLYTVEQAADDFSLEMGTRLGFTPEEIFDYWLRSMSALHARVAANNPPEIVAEYYAMIGERTPDECKALLDQGFTQTDAHGRSVPVTISLGRLDEPHHASCYRLYNLFREARAHRYVPGPRQPDLEPAWSELRARAEELTRTAVPPPAPTPQQ